MEKMSLHRSPAHWHVTSGGRRENTLELIWRGDISPATGQGARRITRALAALLPLRIVTLVAASRLDRSLLIPAETELLPDLPLGDVLAEELGIDVPDGSLVVIGDAALLSGPLHDDDLSYELGILIAEALLGVVKREIFQLDRETDALYAMACSYHRLVGGAGFRHLGVIPAQFRAGLAAGLCTYWAGARSARSDTSGLFLRPDFLESPRLRDYLARVDASFTAPASIPAGLMLFTGGPCSYGGWLKRVEKAVMTGLRGRASRTCDGGSPHDLRA